MAQREHTLLEKRGVPALKPGVVGADPAEFGLKVAVALTQAAKQHTANAAWGS